MIEKQKRCDFILLHNLGIQAFIVLNLRFSFSEICTLQNPIKFLKVLVWTHFLFKKQIQKKNQQNKQQLRSILAIKQGFALFPVLFTRFFTNLK